MKSWALNPLVPSLLLASAFAQKGAARHWLDSINHTHLVRLNIEMFILEALILMLNSKQINL